VLCSKNEIVKILKSGEVAAIPTETVYGLAARIDDPQAIAKIFSVKDRPSFDPLIVHISRLDQAKYLAKRWNPVAEFLAKNLWPGPLTLILEKSDLVSDAITAGSPKVGIRMPNHELALEVLSEVGVPLAAPSANKFGRTSPTCALHVEEEFHSQIAVLDGGDCQVGVESTILEIEELGRNSYQLQILRPGVISASQMRVLLTSMSTEITWTLGDFESELNKGPGGFKFHYMPSSPLIGLPEELFDEVKKSGIKLKQWDWFRRAVKIVSENSEEKNAEFGGLQPYNLNPDLENSQVSFMEISAEEDPRLFARRLYAELRSRSKRSQLILYPNRSFLKKESWLPIYNRLTKASLLM
jgi:L-threonylcarbamoyladenylate synthase